MDDSRRSSSRSSAGPIPLSQLLDRALSRLRPLTPHPLHGDTMLFAGNPQETVPRALILDTRLTPLERNAWQVFRMLLNQDGINAFPSYEQLRPYLTSLPYSGQASEETVARALTLLRLTRWLTLVRHRRDPATGRVQGNLYVLHDEALTPFEAIQLDGHYLESISHALTHASKTIQHVGAIVLQELLDDPMLSGRTLPSRLSLMIRRLDGNAPFLAPSSDSEDSESRESVRLRNPKADGTVRTVSTIDKNTERTVPRAREAPRLQLPEAFRKLKPEQQTGALAALERVEPKLQQLVLDEWAARCRAAAIRNPAGYLFGIMQKALRGEFNPTHRSTRASPP